MHLSTLKRVEPLHRQQIIPEKVMFSKFMPAFFTFTLLGALASCASAPPSSPADGIWDFTMSSPFGAVNATATMTTDGDVLNGSFDLGNGRMLAIENGVITDSQISFSIQRDGSDMVYEMSATIEGNTATGIAKAMGAVVPWTMTRQQ